ncbi:thiol:disulfide interchange protein [Terasakiispira papahanaumokuakeensis]|uniref:Thiol:disulfide interchange protein n=1 Tax=Terasakiispira papahanaumokuakeensis TaxID=197479 RepID=A0A1E2VAT6_9GAMM|nr:DsbE family thiol:disulfide interchange protein [Terasakiispira papahanaumokuakeensis]ODC04129.1 thiol:disulfide interchange protein [Terasakiispira papahanaumokuakeensis]
MRRLVLFIPLAIFLVLAVFFMRGLSLNPMERASTMIGQPLPEFSLKRLDAPHQVVTRDDLLGQVFLLNVWGSWCPSCYDEHEYIVAAAKAGVPVIGLNYKDTPEKAHEYLRKMGNPYQMNLQEPEGMRALAFDLGVYGAPETFLVDREGTIRYHLTGVVTETLLNETLLPEVRRWQKH